MVFYLSPMIFYLEESYMMRKILLVDDEKIERSGICMLLQRMPEEFEVREAANGVEALKVL